MRTTALIRSTAIRATAIAALAVAPTVLAGDPPPQYAASCGACHAVGVAGAPATGDAEAWAPRMAKGMEALVASVRNGLNAMPPAACATAAAMKTTLRSSLTWLRRSKPRQVRRAGEPAR